jgi:hypothetical protein
LELDPDQSRARFHWRDEIRILTYLNPTGRSPSHAFREERVPTPRPEAAAAGRSGRSGVARAGAAPAHGGTKWRGRIRAAKRQFCDLLGDEPAELLQGSVAEITHPTIPDMMKASAHA